MIGAGFDEITVYLTRTTKGEVSVEIKFWYNYTGLKIHRLFDFVSPEGEVLKKSWISGEVIHHNNNHVIQNSRLAVRYDDGDTMFVYSDFVDRKISSCVWDDLNTERNKALFMEHGNNQIAVGAFFPDGHVFLDDDGNVCDDNCIHHV